MSCLYTKRDLDTIQKTITPYPSHVFVAIFLNTLLSNTSLHINTEYFLRSQGLEFIDDISINLESGKQADILVKEFSKALY